MSFFGFGHTHSVAQHGDPFGAFREQQHAQLQQLHAHHQLAMQQQMAAHVHAQQVSSIAAQQAHHAALSAASSAAAAAAAAAVVSSSGTAKRSVTSKRVPSSSSSHHHHHHRTGTASSGSASRRADRDRAALALLEETGGLLSMDDAMSVARHVAYSSIEARAATFSEWPHDDSWTATPALLVAEGFFLVPQPNYPDRCLCWVCGVQLVGWEQTDHPRTEHRSHSGSCPLLTGNIRKASPPPATAAITSTPSASTTGTAPSSSSSPSVLDGATSFDKVRKRRLAKPSSRSDKSSINAIMTSDEQINLAKRARVEALRTCFARELLLSTIVLPSHLEPLATVDLKTLARATSRTSLSLLSSAPSAAVTTGSDPLVAPIAPRTSSGLSLIVQPT